jgi:hypothetical protein
MTPPTPPTPNTAASAAGLTRLRRWQTELLINEQNLAAAKLRIALPRDPRKSPPPAVTPGPDGGAVGRIDDLSFQVSWRIRGAILVATAHIARWDRDWSPLPPVVVEMRGGFLSGVIMPGDWVQLPKRYEPGQSLHELTNLTRNGHVEMVRKRVKRVPDDIATSLPCVADD